MRNCGGARFVGNESMRAATRNRCRFGEVAKVYEEESGWHSETYCVCACVCVCIGVRVCVERVMFGMTQQGVEPCLHQSG